nr:MAG TPA: intron associated endonuclease [Bacteriophage sp.]
MSFIVYKHTSPSNKVYIGITKLNLIKRWQGGKGYINNTYFFRAILKYG